MFNKDLFKNVFYIVFIFFLFFISYMVYQNNDNEKTLHLIMDKSEETRTITVNGEAKMSVKPDLAILNFTVLTEGESPKKVTKENNEIVSKVINALKNFGIKKEDISTKNYNLNPKYDWSVHPAKIKGYTLRQNLIVKVRNLDSIEDIMALVMNNGVNQFNNISFTIDDKDKYIDELREKAVADAKEKAEKIANTVGLKLKKIIKYEENQNNYNPPIPMYRTMASAMKDDVELESNDFSIEEGSQELNFSVSLTYEL